ncbi:lipid A biosynthesis acyltransferase [Polaromonas sp. C04]|uniref:lysophospholipid acyltransferase family protein n=1 Tax=Polaromonas sp. C04 TaxID=1945857 RepID=UPI0009857810|nr:lipid A biosynthesis acyltransferase [Polaromonas sp. C04]OOG51491.1 lipid A biosynthesis acyltransferase [Polaromonas sp. C04]
MKIASHGGIWFMRGLSRLPLAWIRALGWGMGCVLYVLAVPRRRVASTNLMLCFPEHTAQQRRALVLQNFIYFAQTWLDRSWLWHASPQVTLRRLKLTGEVAQLAGDAPTLIFAPHFLGMDAGATALSQQVPRNFNTIVTPQRNEIVDDWISQGRRRFGNARLFTRFDGTKTIVASLRAGEPLYLLPDMNFGPQESIFVPFYGVQAATVPSLSRFARLGRAKVVPVITRITAQGYETRVLPAWLDFPSDDVVADTALMNRRLQDYIDTMPEQYYWVHKRFKTRPPGEPSVY